VDASLEWSTCQRDAAQRRHRARLDGRRPVFHRERLKFSMWTKHGGLFLHCLHTSSAARSVRGTPVLWVVSRQHGQRLHRRRYALRTRAIRPGIAFRRFLLSTAAAAAAAGAAAVRGGALPAASAAVAGGAAVVRRGGGGRCIAAAAAAAAAVAAAATAAGAVPGRLWRQRNVQQLDEQREAAGLAEGGLQRQKHGRIARQPLQRLQPLQLLLLAFCLRQTEGPNLQGSNGDNRIASRFMRQPLRRLQPLQLLRLALRLHIIECEDPGEEHAPALETLSVCTGRVALFLSQSTRTHPHAGRWIHH